MSHPRHLRPAPRRVRPIRAPPATIVQDIRSTKIRSFSPLPDDLSLEELVPDDHFYRRLQAQLDLSFVRELVEPLYAKGGRPSVDPVVFFKLQLVMFFEDLRSERQLMRAVSDRLSVEVVPGLRPLRAFARPLQPHPHPRTLRLGGLPPLLRADRRGVRGGRTRVGRGTVLRRDQGRGQRLHGESNPEVRRRGPPRRTLREGTHENEARDDAQGPSPPPPESDLDALPTAEDRGLQAQNEGRGDWISSDGKPDRTIMRHGYRRKSDYVLSPTDPDAALMQYKRGASRLGYHAHYVVDGGKARVILNVLVTPADVMENQPMLDLLWRTIFRWRARVRRVTGDATYGTRENIAAIEKSVVRAYTALPEQGKRTSLFTIEDFLYDADRDLYTCPQGEVLRRQGFDRRGGYVRYAVRTDACEGCPLKSKCTNSPKGRWVSRSIEEEYIERVRAYRETEAYRKALRKRAVWVEPLFGEAKEWHGLRRFRLRRLEKVNTEALMIASGQNVKRLMAFGIASPRRAAHVAALRRPEARRCGFHHLRAHRESRQWCPERTFSTR